MATDMIYSSFRKQTVIPSGRTYSHVHVKPSSNKPYILFLHGFPSTSYVWRHQIEYFSQRGYGIVAPDLLGYRETDKPVELDAYSLKNMATEVIALMDCLGVDKVIGVGHDWGSFLLSRTANYFEDRFLAFAWLSIGYSPPGGKFSVDEINAMSRERLGWTVFGYWYFFDEPDAPELLNHNAESFHSLIFAADPEQVKTDFAPPGAARRWVEAGRTGPLPSYLTPKEFDNHWHMFSPSHGGSITAPLNWYKAMMANVNLEDNMSISNEQHYIHLPTLLILCDKDYVAVPLLQEECTVAYVKNLRVETLDSKHWVQLERRDEVNQLLEEFFTEKASPVSSDKTLSALPHF